MGETQRRVDAVRAKRSEVENHLIDEYRAGKISRREFVRRGTVVGMSIPMVGFLASACGSGDKEGGSDATDSSKKAEVKAGGAIKAGVGAPAGELDPVIVNNQGGLVVLGQTGEYLTWSDKDLKLQPRIAESWKPNKDASAWTFKIRQGVTYTDGRKLTAEDVVETFDRLVDPKNSANSLSATTGVLSKGNTKAVDASTVEFELDAPYGNFPYIVSSDNYNAIILPADYDGNWDKTFIGTGPWKLQKFTPDVGVTYVKNPSYWDKTRQPNADTLEIRFYAKEQAAVLGLQGGEVDVLLQFSPTGGKALLTDQNVKTIELPSSAHRQVHMRTDKEPFQDKRVRQAVALLVNRQALVEGLLNKKADLGNDSPFAPAFPSTDKSVAQRKQDVEKAKALLAEAGKPDGFSVQLDGWDGFEMPDYAQLIQNDVKPAGIKIKLNITDAASYYGDAVFGSSRWLDSTMGMTEYGHRGVPNVFLGAPLKKGGTWNGAHFKNEEYDRLVTDYSAALDLDAQRTSAKQIQELLLDEVPILFTYFYYFLTGTKTNVANVEVTGMGHADLSKTGFTA